MNINQWAIKHGVSHAALHELRVMFGTVSTEPNPTSGESEAAIQTRIRLEATRKGARIWRNNVGVTPYECPNCFEKSQPVRYGLCNDSKQMNTVIKSADLVGIRPVVITQAMIGSTIGQFVAREVKAGEWQYSGSPREVAQLKFLELVISLGGDAAFANSEGTL